MKDSLCALIMKLKRQKEGKHSTRDAKTSYNNGVMIEAAS